MPGEFDLIRRHFTRAPRHTLLGVGDDAALVRALPGRDLAIATDMLNEGVHFFTGTDAAHVGHKALAVNLSDMAAMGASPHWATLAIALPSADDAWVAGFAAGFFALADRFGVDLIGGDTTRGPLSIAVTIIGDLPEGTALRRDGARPGDDIWVSGELGAAALAVLARRGKIDLDAPTARIAGARLDRPEPRVRLGDRLRGVASAAIDVSDGFASDLGHVLERSGVGARVEYERLPRAPLFRAGGTADALRMIEATCVLSGGDDYELAFTAPSSRRTAIDAIAAELGIALARVGAIHSGAGLHIVDDAGLPVAPVPGYDHFDGAA